MSAVYIYVKNVGELYYQSFQPPTGIQMCQWDSGEMNIFKVIEGVVYTPTKNGEHWACLPIVNHPTK